MTVRTALIVLGAIAVVGLMYWLGKATQDKNKTESET